MYGQTRKRGAGFPPAFRRLLVLFLGTGVLIGSLFLMGCASKEETVATPASGQATSGAAAPKPTAEQDAAKQRAIDEGPAIQAANDPTKGGQ